jgi:hypothetical protein
MFLGESATKWSTGGIAEIQVNNDRALGLVFL